MVTQIGRYYHTLSYLRFEQIVYRVYYRLKYFSIKPLTKTIVRHWPNSWNGPRWRSSSFTAADKVVFFGEEGTIRCADDWNHSRKPKLWLYHLHYFDDLHAIDSPRRKKIHTALIDAWIRDNPVLMGNGWEPYVLSQRLVNWIKWFSPQKNLKSIWLRSLALQAQALNEQLEYHILGNHLFANGKALVFVGTYLDGDEADKWLLQGLNILDREIPEQFLKDGGHFERSPMYHANLIWDMCDLVNLSNCSNHEALRQRRAMWVSVIQDGLNWMASMIHPDGDISFFNDAAFEMGPRYSDLVHYADNLGCGRTVEPASASREFSCQYLEESGYCVLDFQNGKAILDVGPIGPDYQPGHAHADTLSFELSLFGQRIFVNSGTSQYGLCPERHRQRSTRAHNTVEVDDQNSSEVWSGFRVARRAYPLNFSMNAQREQIHVRCSHTGYLRLPGKNIHSRHWLFRNKSLKIKDVVSGDHRSATARFYLHPSIDAKQTTTNQLTLDLANGHTVIITVEGDAPISLENANWHPRFGSADFNQCVTIPLYHGNLSTDISWS